MKTFLMFFLIVFGSVIYAQNGGNAKNKNGNASAGVAPVTATPSSVPESKTKSATGFFEKDKEVHDTIFLLGGKKFAANVQQVGSVEVIYSLPAKPDSIIRVERKQFEKILFKSGRLEVYSKPVMITVDEGQWQAVLITRDEKQVQGLYKRGLVAAKSPSNPKSKKAGQQSAIIRLQKKAASQGGSIILITHEESFGAYGDVPGVYIEGTTYGDKPLEAGTSVVEDKDKHP